MRSFASSRRAMARTRASRLNAPRKKWAASPDPGEAAYPSDTVTVCQPEERGQGTKRGGGPLAVSSLFCDAASFASGPRPAAAMQSTASSLPQVRAGPLRVTKALSAPGAPRLYAQPPRSRDGRT